MFSLKPSLMVAFCIACRKTEADLDTQLYPCSMCATRTPSLPPLSVCEACFPAASVMFSVTWSGPVNSFDVPPKLSCRLCDESASLDISARFAETLSLRSDTTKFATLAVARFPWLLVLHDARPSDKLAALKRLKFVSPSHSDDSDASLLVSSGMDPNRSLTLSLVAQAALGAGATAGQKSAASAAFEAARRQQAVHTRWKELLLPPKGSFSTLLSYLQDRLASSTDVLVQALAQERMQVVKFVASVTADSTSANSYSSAASISARGSAMVYGMLRHLSRDIKDASMRQSPEFQVLGSLYSSAFPLMDVEALMVKLTPAKHRQKAAPHPAVVITPNPGRQPKTRNPSHDRTRQDRSRTPARRRRQSRRRSPAPKSPKRSHGSQKKVSRDTKGAKDSKSFKSSMCPNCAVNGLEVKHSLAECRALSNKCFLPCIRCHSGVHWRNECPQYSKKSPAK